MFSLFKHQKDISEDPTPQELYEDYVRLVSHGDKDNFLDFDTTFLIEDRDLLEEMIEKKAYSPSELEEIRKTDELFKAKAKASALHYKHQIGAGASGADYLEAVLQSLSYPAVANKDKWWYHLLD